jgi:hypothetical protein
LLDGNTENTEKTEKTEKTYFISISLRVRVYVYQMLTRYFTIHISRVKKAGVNLSEIYYSPHFRFPNLRSIAK